MTREEIENLSVDTLKSMLREKGVFYNDSWSKETLVDLVERNQNVSKSINNGEVDGIGKVGAILNIVFASFALVFSVFLIIFLIGIPLVIGEICAIVWNVKFLKTGNSKTTAGVLGLIFGGLIGGILVLVYDKNN